MALAALKLRYDFTVPFQPQPFHAIENGQNCFLRMAGAVGVLDADMKLAAVPSRKQPVVQRRAGGSNMHKTGRGGGDACYDGHDQGALVFVE